MAIHCLALCLLVFLTPFTSVAAPAFNKVELRQAFQNAQQSLTLDRPILYQYESLTRFDDTRTGKERSGENVAKGQVYEDASRISFTEDLWQLEKPERKHLRYHKVFWDGKRCVEWHRDFVEKNNDMVGGLSHDTSEFEVCRADSSYGSFMRGQANLRQPGSRTWFDVFDAAIDEWNVSETVVDGGTGWSIRIPSDSPDTTYEARFSTDETGLKLVQFCVSTVGLPGAPYKTFTTTFTPLEYQMLDGVKVISKGQLEEVATYAEGGEYRYTVVTTRSDIRIDPAVDTGPFFALDAPDGTRMTDFSFTGIAYRVVGGQLRVDYQPALVEALKDSVREVAGDPSPENSGRQPENVERIEAGSAAGHGGTGMSKRLVVLIVLATVVSGLPVVAFLRGRRKERGRG